MKNQQEKNLELKNAELEEQLAEKNRYLEIEASLERVRTVAMGMRAADDLLNICQVLFEEFKALGFGDLRNAMINILHDDKGYFLDYDFNDSGASVTPFLYNSHPMMEHQVELTRSATDAFIEHSLTGDELEDFIAFRVRNGEPPDPKLENISGLYYYFYSIGVGSVGISTFSPLNEEKLNVLKRFRNVFDLAYRRYADIELAAAQAREAQIELALERVRARTMAMQKSEELSETAFILFQQFKELGENPDQATIGIVNEEEWVIEYWVTMYGSQINKVFKFPIDEPNVTNRIYKAWKAQEKSLVIDLSGKELYDFTTFRASLGGAAFNPEEKRRVINVAFFSKGIINVQSSESRSAESIRLLERFANVFEGTYTRFLDLQKSEALAMQAKEDLVLLQIEKRRAEDALTELQATQKQLIQSEKMASLGELTAGIAHEIQNPLNFVNNFSEVNQEMIDELEEELRAGNIEEALALAADIKGNELKISHHGKRADGIVKGMLQHSRSGGGEKQTTNINALADEFFRLSYHGLRAKDKAFNAELTTYFDPDLPYIKLISQDIGRVLLNLFNNAFYAVNKKSKTLEAGYRPEVSVTTSSEDGQIFIKVKDNGIGMPEYIKEKIMQPFFTTKPTGEGTGLGLSLSYDIIVKGHGGNIIVDTKEGDYTEFTVLLPIS